MQQLVLGTVQQGMDHGLRGKLKPPREESIALLQRAYENGVQWIDTASAYGAAESIVGEFLRKTPEARQHVRVVSKLRPNCLDDVPATQFEAVVEKELQGSLDRIGVSRLDAYLLHSSRYVFDHAIVRALEATKSKGKTAQDGVFIYTPEEALHAAMSPHIDCIQVPFNVLDRRLLKTEFFSIAKDNGKTVFARSCFLLGLLLMDPDDIPARLAHCAHHVRELHATAENTPSLRATPS